ncbi:unnamed protein product [Durusdinium trenchii]|uniref:Uncharacterized protein n=1 Tax=Durusdinium trenchii TaxID=1381693 RepID=A0ABP0N012_9DINO
MDVDGSAVAQADVPMAAAAAPGQRLFCPVPGCPCADGARARGWASAGTLRTHVDAHLGGSLAGRVPACWLQDRDLQQCLVCGLSVAKRYGIHPTCRPTARAAAGPGPALGPRGPDDGALSSLSEIQCSNTPTLRHVLARARYAWAQALARACAAAAEYNNERAWVHLLMLPQSVLCAPPRSGRKHAGAFTLERLQRWQDGERATLWVSRPQRPRQHARQLTEDQKRVAAALSDLNSAFEPAQKLTAAAALALSQKELSRRADEAAWTCQLALRVRLGVPEARGDVWCPKCDAVLDTYGHHSGMCSAGGERALRHNGLRDLVYSCWAEKGCLRPEKERPGLLLLQQPDEVHNAPRRPADVFLPLFHGRPTALDFAITAPQRLDVLGAAGITLAASAYTEHKRRHLDTAEALESIGRAAGSDGSTLLQEASVLVRSWRARAALRRRAELDA